MAQELDAGEWIADGVLATLGEDPEISGQGKHVLLCGGVIPASLPVTKIFLSTETNATLRHHANPDTLAPRIWNLSTPYIDTAGVSTAN